MMDDLVFKSGDSVGFLDAEDDQRFLDKCFVEIDGQEVVTDSNRPESIILGRTGAGKTALIKKIQKDHTGSICVSPEDLALNYISNSSAISFFDDLGVPLERFYKLLWQHVFVVELIKKRYSVYSEADLRRALSIIHIAFTGPTRKRALAYLQDWQHKFWEDTEVRIKEIVTQVEDLLSAQIGAGIGNIDAKLMAQIKENSKVRSDVIQKANTVVMEAVHLGELNEILKVLNEEIFTDSMDPYYILIDSLDEDWVDDSIKYRLIKSLIECIKSFRAVRNVKIIIAMRSDLLERVFKYTTRAGFQRDKYDSLIFPIKWSEEKLGQLMERRVDELLAKRYTKQVVMVKDIFSDGKIYGGDPKKYIISRSLNRRREVIIFLNTCIVKAYGKKKIDGGIVRSAGLKYSQDSMQSIIEEWIELVPNIEIYIGILKDKETPFRIAQVNNEQINEIMEEIFILGKYEGDYIAETYFQNSTNKLGGMSTNLRASAADRARREIFSLFYVMGLVGLKLSKNLSRQWSHIDSPLVSSSDVHPTATADVHIAFHRALNVQTGRRSKEKLDWQ